MLCTCHQTESVFIGKDSCAQSNRERVLTGVWEVFGDSPRQTRL